MYFHRGIAGRWQFVIAINPITYSLPPLLLLLVLGRLRESSAQFAAVVARVLYE